MFTTISAAHRIAQAQAEFESSVRAGATKSGPLQMGYQGGGRGAMAHFQAQLNFWVSLADSGNRYWNALGIGNPFKDNHTIIAEINPPKSGIDRRISGVFVQDNLGKTYFAHRGRVGGGRKGIGKKAFMSWYPGVKTRVRDGDQISEMIIIDAIDSPDLLKNLAAFTVNVSTFKEVAVSNG